MRAAQMKERPSFTLMKQTDVQTIYHMQMPRWLFSDPRYADMSPNAKVTYLWLQWAVKNTFLEVTIMPRKKVVPEENPEQVNDMEMEAQAQEEGVEQPPADASQEETSPPAAGEEAHQSDPPPIPQKSDRQSFYDLDFNALDRDLTAEERQEWNSIYASYRGRSALTGTIIGVDPLHITVRNKETGAMEKKTMYCAIVVPYRVRVVIPDTEMWEQEQARPDFVLQNMGGDTVIIVAQRFETEKRQMYGKLMSKW